MASAAAREGEAEENGIEFLSLSEIDLQSFAQDELLCLAQFSGPFPESKFHDIVIPKLDRRFFNESAGSRRQTYGKCGANRHWISEPENSDDHDDERGGKGRDRSFDSELTGRSGGDRRAKQQKAGVVEKNRTAKAVARAIVERKGRFRARDRAKQASGGKRKVGSGGRRVVWSRKRGSDSSRTSGSSDDSLWTDSAENHFRRTASSKRRRERKSTTVVINGVSAIKQNGSIDAAAPRKRRRPIFHDRVIDAPQELNEQQVPFFHSPAGDVSEESPKPSFRERVVDLSEEVLSRSRRKKRRPSTATEEEGFGRGRKRRSRSNLSDDESDKRIVSRQCEGEDEARGVRQYVGEAEMAERLANMKGRWSSSRMTRKIVDAKGFPKGWTVCVGLRQKDGRPYFDYRNWTSPEGKVWTSYKAATTYLISTVGQDPCSNRLTSSMPSDNTICEGKTSNAEEGSSHVATCAACDGDSTGVTLQQSHDGYSKALQLPNETQTVEDAHRMERRCFGTGNCILLSKDNVDKFLRVSSEADEVTNSMQSIGGQVTIKMGPSIYGKDGEDHRKPLGTEEVQKSWDSERKFHSRVINNNHRGQRVTNFLTAQDVQVSEGRKYLECCPRTKEIDSNNNSCHRNSSNPVFCDMRHPTYGQEHKCSLCGKVFSSLLKLRRHLKRQKHLITFDCEVCGRHFTSITLLLGHRVKMGHPRVTKVNRYSTSLPARGQAPVASPTTSGSEISNIVNGLLSDVNENPIRDMDNPSRIKQLTNETVRASSKTANYVTERVKGETGQEVLKSPEASDVFECQTCHKIFYHRSKYWGHLSIHSNKRKKVLTSSALPSSETERLASSMVEEPKPNVEELVRGRNGVESGFKHTACAKQTVTKSVFWKLLDDSLPRAGARHEPVPCQEEATARPLAPCTKEEAADTEGSIDMTAPLELTLDPNSGLLQVNTSSFVLPMQTESTPKYACFGQKAEENKRDMNVHFDGPKNCFEKLDGNQAPQLAQDNLACPVCEMDDERPRPLICDWCEKEFHLGCPRPPLQFIPSAWICPICQNGGI